jgi:cytochrome P450
LFPNGRSLFFPAERKRLERIIAPILTRRRGAATKDILSLILNARSEDDEPLTDDEVRNEIVTFMLAGHETTATALTWSWYLLAHNPQIEERMHAELDAVLGERTCAMEDIPKLPYTGAVFQEAMRLYPPALGFARRAKEEVELGGYTIPKGASVFVSPYITQRNPAYFPAPDTFQPERWEAGTAPKFAYFPFGGGAKMCIGEPFAKMEGIISLAQIGRKWRLKSSDHDLIGIGQGMLLKPDRPILLTACERHLLVPRWG